MDSKAVVLQGTRYPICLVLAKQPAPSGFIAVATNTPDSAYKFVAEVGAVLSGDAAKRLDLIQLLNVAGINCPRQATARETASALIKALTSGAITCYQQQVKSTIQVSDNTRSSQSSNSASSAVPSNAKKATQAPASNKGSASNTTASETPITEQECRSDPVSMLTGEEILPLTDFSLAANRPLTWRRLYRSSHCNQKTILGNGWRHDYLVQLTEHYLPPPKVGPKKKGTYWLEYHDEHGATHKFEKVKPGQSSYQLSSNLVLHYKENGKQVLVTPDDKHLTFMPGGSAWLLEKIINEKGQSTRFYYDSMERLQRIEVNKVRGCVLKYNKHGLLKTVHAYRTDEQGKLVLLDQPLASYEYDEQSNLVAATNQFAEQERYEYNAANLLIKRTRASGFSHHFEWDSYGYDAKCIKQWGDDNTYCYQFEYQGNKTTSIDSRGNQEHFVHNEQGKLIEHTDANGNITRYDYNSLGQKVAQTDALGHQTLYTYTEYGQLESVTQADGNRTQFGYNQLGQQVVVILPNGEKIKRQYSASGLLQSETQADGRIALYSYDKQGNLTQHVTPNGHVLKYTWNEQGELLAKQHNDELIRYSYDNLGRINATINQAGLLTQFKYNEQGQLVETTAFEQSNPDNKQQQLFTYDDAGRLVRSQNGNGDTTEQHFEGLSQPHCVIQPDGSALHLTYDKERNLTAIERSDGHIYRINYDANENPIQITGFDGTEQQFKYDACNRLEAVTQSDKRHVNIKRDKLGRVISQHASLATNKHIVNNANHYSYTPEGKIARAHNEQSTIKQSFDKGGRLLSVEQIHNQSQTHKLAYSYDDYGRRHSLTLPDSTTLYYNYNSFGQLSTIQVKRADGELEKIVELGYDSQNNIKTQRFGNQVTLNQAFDVFGRLTQQQLSHPEHTLFDSCDYQYDAVNQLIAREEQGISCQNTQFEYNSLGQLVQQNLADAKSDTQAPETAKQFQWDSFGNPISQTQVQHDEAVNKQEANDAVIHSQVNADRLTHFGDSDFEYDDCGNQVRETGKGIKTHREYNAFNQLSSFNNNGTLTHYDYDPLGRRIAKQTEHGKIDYIWDNDQLIGEYQHGEYTWYINLPNQFHPVALIKQGELYYYHLDQLNTPRFVTNNNAEVVWQNHADVYGYEEPEANAGFNKENSFTQPIRFQGQYFDEESGLHYNRYRYYSPKQQRFINQDPIGLVGGINHYQYAPNPVNWVDPFGLSCKEGTATVLRIGRGKDTHFAIQVKTKLEVTKTHQLGGTDDDGISSRTLIDSYNEEDDFAGKLIEKATIKLPDAIAAIDLQRQLILNSEIALDAAGGDPDNLQTPLYDAATQSCLTHVFDVLEAGGIEGTPKNSSIRDKSVRKFARDMMNGKIGEEDISEVVEEFEDNKATWKIDSKGRPISVEATLKSTYHGKRSHEEKKAQSEAGGEDRLADDDGGHLVGHRFMSDQGTKNLFPQNSNFNRGSYKSMENEWADWTEAGFEVKLKVLLEPSGAARPTDIISEYEVCDPKSGDVVYEKRHKFNNQSGETFGRVAKKDIEKFKGIL